MKGKIFLTSCGLKEKQESQKFLDFIKPSLAGKRAVVVTNATTTGHNERAIEPTKNRLSQAGCVVDAMVLTADSLDVLDSADLIYVVGGDVTPLLNLIAETDFKNKIIEFLNRGGIYIGESAGSIITGKSAKWYYEIKKKYSERYNILPKSFDCLGLTDVYVFPHYDKAEKDMKMEVEKFEKQNGIKITKLADGDFVEK